MLFGIKSRTLRAAVGQPRYNLLFRVDKLVFLLPHSNTREETVFSMIHKNNLSFHANLGKGKQSSILTGKLSPESAKDFVINKSLLKIAKSAT